MDLRVGLETVMKTENVHQPVIELRFRGNMVRLLAKGPRHLCSLLSAGTRLCYVSLLRTAALRLIVQSELDVPTFAIRRLHACHHATAPSGRRWNCGREVSGNFA